MRLLVLGGTAFLSRELARQAVEREHQVTCAARGTSAPPAGVEFVRVDRDRADGLDALAGHDFDAVIDVGRRPTQVRRALAAFAGRADQWTFVSTVSVYADDTTPGQHAATAPLHPPLAAGADEADQNNYGFNKVACEQAVAEAASDHALVVRAGLIVGPGDPSDRFTYWPARLARGGEVLAPGAADEPVQLIDVRDLAAWMLTSTERRLTGTFDGIGSTITRGELLAGTAEGVGTEPELTWVAQDFLAEHGVNPWSGPRSLPLWLPLPEYGGFMTRDVTDAERAGLTVRSVAETAADTLDWDRTRTEPRRRAGLTAAEETELLATWHSTGRAPRVRRVGHR